jgi:hypothetical protein
MNNNNIRRAKMYRRGYSFKVKTSTIINIIKRMLKEAKCTSPIYEYHDGVKVLRNDILAKAFANGKPEFMYVERPECKAFVPMNKVRKNKREATNGDNRL